MTRDDVIDLLSIIAVTDHRTVGDTDIDMWQRLIGHLSCDECVDAILAHFQDHPDVWLQPGHIVARVRAARADALARMDPDERAESLAGQHRTPRDRHGYIDKSAPEDDEYPADWTSSQRVSAYWQRIQDARDMREYEQAIHQPRTLTKTRPATAAQRAKAMQELTAHQYSIHDLDEELPYVNPLAVKCGFCNSPPGQPCTTAGVTNQDRDRCPRPHPTRIEAAARAAGFSEDQIRAIVVAACKAAVTP